MSHNWPQVIMANLSGPPRGARGRKSRLDLFGVHHQARTTPPRRVHEHQDATTSGEMRRLNFTVDVTG